MSTLASLVVSLEANTVAFSEGMNKAAEVAEHSMKRVEAAADFAKESLELFGVGVGLVEFKEFIAHSIEVADELGNLSQKLGIGVEELGAYKIMAAESDVSLDQFANGVKKLSVYMVDHNDRLQKAGITAKTAQGAMIQLSNIFHALPDGAEKTALAITLFGKSGTDMIPILNKGSDALKKLQEHAEALNPYTAEMAENSEKLKIKQVELNAQFDKIGVALGEKFLPILTAVASELADTSGKASGLKDVFWFFGEAMKTVVVLGGNVAYIFKEMGVTIGGIAAQLNAAAHLDFKGFTAINDQMKADAIEARKEIDAWSKKILDLGNEKPKIEVQVDTSKLAKATADAQAKILNGPKHGDRISDPWANFVDGLDRMIEKSGKGEYAMLRLEAAQKAEGNATKIATANAKIDALQREQSAKAVQDYVDKLYTEEDRYKEQYDLIGLNALQTEKLTNAMKRRAEAQQLIEQAEKSGKPIDAAGQAALWDKVSSAIKRESDQIDDNYAKVNSWDTGTKRALNDYVDNVANAANQSSKLWGDAFSGMEDALVQLVKTGKLDFKSLADSIITDLIRIQVQEKVTKPLANLLNGSGSLFDGGGSSGGGGSDLWQLAGNLFKADGGPVNSGQAYIVGEQGPEWFVPPMSGTILPNGVSPTVANGGGSQPVNVSFNITTNDSRSFSNSLAENRQMIVGIINQALNGRGRMGVTP